MKTTQAEMMRTMSIADMDLEGLAIDTDISLAIDENLKEDWVMKEFDVSQPLQTLFDDCLNFISVNDFNV